MKKLILKTIGITVAFIFAFLLIAYGVFALFLPSKTAKFYDGLGSYKTAVRYMERAYEKSGDIKDLDEACLYALKTDDNGLIALHLGKLFGENLQSFRGYSESKSQNGDDYFDFMAGRYVCALYKNSDEKKAVTESFRLTFGYKSKCAVRSLLVETLSANDKDAVKAIKTKLEETIVNFTELEKEIANQDMVMIDLFLSR